MAEKTLKGEKIYEYDLNVFEITEYGMSLAGILSGTEKLPPQGVRIDVAFKGHAVGRLTGKVQGIDYLRIRADGRIDLDIRAILVLDDGNRIALSADGVGVPRAAEQVADLSENIILSTVAKDYAWVNTRQIWGSGTVNFSTGKIHIDAYMQ